MKCEQRLRNETEFAQAREQGRNFSNRYVALYVREKGGEQTRIGVAAGRKLGKAHIRNRARRLLREAVNRRLTELKRGMDIVLVARAAMLGRGLSEVAPAVDELLTRSKLILPPQSPEQSASYQTPLPQGERLGEGPTDGRVPPAPTPKTSSSPTKGRTEPGQP